METTYLTLAIADDLGPGPTVVDCSPGGLVSNESDRWRYCVYWFCSFNFNQPLSHHTHHNRCLIQSRMELGRL